MFLLAQILNISLRPGPVRVPLPKPLESPFLENKDNPTQIFNDEKLKPENVDLKKEIIPKVIPSRQLKEFELDGPLWKIKIKGDSPYTYSELKTIYQS